MPTIKPKSISFRLSEDEYKILLTKSQDNGIDISTYIREKLFFDTPYVELNSFEFKMLKSISYTVGAIRGIMNLKLSNTEKNLIHDEVEKIMIANGLKESDVLIKRD